MARLPDRVKVRLSGEPPVRVDGQCLDPQLQLLRALRRRRVVHGLVEPTVAIGRARFRAETAFFRGPVTAVAAVRDLEAPGPGGPLRMRHYAPHATSPRPLTVYLHGGGFVIGDLDTHDEPCRLLCHHANVHVLSVEYRLAPEHPFPASVEDARAAVGWARANAAALGADPSRVAVGGDSAGANLSAVAAALAAREAAAPVAQLLVYPPTDATTARASHALFGEGYFLTQRDREAFTRAYLAGDEAARHDTRVSPLRNPDLAGLPPALVATAGFDLLRDEGEAYAQALSAAGVPVRARRFEGLGHGFIHLTGVCPAARRAMLDIAREWRELLDAPGAPA
jgi:acetyl esterase